MMDIAVAVVAVTLITNTGDAVAMEHRLIDFDQPTRTEWYVVNDGVMGGVSRSDITRTDENVGRFSGTLSLENNGGFASVRAMLGRQDLSGFAGVRLRVRGDGRTYQLRFRTDDRFDGIAYRASFQTRDGDWVTVTIPFEEFEPVFRGRVLTDVPPLDTSRIFQLSFMLADKNPGPFTLDIEYVEAFRSTTTSGK